jgi:hypothetical protein
VRWRDLGVDVLEGVDGGRDRPVLVALEVLDRGADDGQRRAQLVARVGGELALAAEGDPLRLERLADRHEGAARVDGADARTRRARRRSRRRAA